MTNSCSLRTARNAPESDTWTWPSVSVPLVAAVAAPVLILQASDVLLGELTHIAKDQVRGTLLEIVRLSLLPAFAVSTYTFAKHGATGAFLACFGSILSMVFLFQFRSDVIRPGTFDFWEESPIGWTWPLIVGSISGAVVGLVRASVAAQPSGKARTWIQFVWIGLIIGAAIEAWYRIAISPDSSWSSFAPTRHWALMGLGVILAAVTLTANYWRVQE